MSLRLSSRLVGLSSFVAANAVVAVVASVAERSIERPNRFTNGLASSSERL